MNLHRTGSRLVFTNARPEMSTGKLRLSSPLMFSSGQLVRCLRYLVILIFVFLCSLSCLCAILTPFFSPHQDAIKLTFKGAARWRNGPCVYSWGQSRGDHDENHKNMLCKCNPVSNIALGCCVLLVQGWRDVQRAGQKNDNHSETGIAYRRLITRLFSWISIFILSFC